MSIMETNAPPAGWYPDPNFAGQLRWWDGVQWTDNWRALNPEPVSSRGPLTHNALTVERKVNYVRQQTGHSFLLQFFVLGWFTLWIVPIYYLVSPNHYYHL